MSTDDNAGPRADFAALMARKLGSAAQDAERAEQAEQHDDSPRAEFARWMHAQLTGQTTTTAGQAFSDPLDIRTTE